MVPLFRPLDLNNSLGWSYGILQVGLFFTFAVWAFLNVGYPIRFVEVARNKSITIYYNRLDSRYFLYSFVIFINYYLFLLLFVVTKLTE